MATLTIELHDTGLRAMDAHSRALLPVDDAHNASPGYALRDKHGFLTGIAAAQQSSVQPLNVHHGFWDQLAADNDTGEMAHAHLSRLWARVKPGIDEVLFAVPAHFEAYPLGILHGICRDIGLPVKGFIASPVLAGAHVFHVDLLLNRSVFSLVRDGDLTATHSDPGIGLIAMQKQWMKGMQNEFVRSTRFDPMHKADTEQKLVNQLPRLLEALQQSDTAALEIETYRINVTRGMMAEWTHALQASLCAAARRFLDDEVQASESPTLHLSYSASSLPGLDRVLEKQLNLEVQQAAAEDTLTRLLDLWPEHFEVPPEGQVTWQTATQPPTDGETADI